VLAPGADRRAVQGVIRSRYALVRNIEVMSDREYRGAVIELLRQATGYVKALRWAALLVALIALANAVSVEVRERWRELGVLRAVGMAPRQLYLMMGGEALLKAACASALALALGVAVARLGLDGYIHGELGWVFRLSVPWRVPVLCSALSVLVSLVAVTAPTFRALRMDVARVLSSPR
jgi:putative ABC transport system permease protein